MTNRTYKVFGQCYATTDTINLEVKFNGAVVFNGPVPTKGALAPFRSALAPAQPDLKENEELCTFTVSSDITGEVPMSVKPTGGTCVFGQLSANHTGYSCRWTESEELIVTVAPDAQFDIITSPPPSADYKRNVFLDGVNVDPVNLDNEDEDTTGWLHTISDGSALTFDYFIDPTMLVLDVPTTSPDNTYPYPPLDFGAAGLHIYSTVTRIRPV